MGSLGRAVSNKASWKPAPVGAPEECYDSKTLPQARIVLTDPEGGLLPPWRVEASEPVLEPEGDRTTLFGVQYMLSIPYSGCGYSTSGLSWL